ncbi:MAG: cyclic nucleotide-binding domain-containing protein [Acetobacteraceae bacterium]|nr:cyclic nucleotide-binding domain-containing protein [Acetobacteraceae bacterium]
MAAGRPTGHGHGGLADVWGLPAGMTRSWVAKIPAVLLAILAGTAVHHLLAMVIGLDTAGPMLGAMPSVAAGEGNLGQAIDALRHIDPLQLGPQIAPVAISMALVTMIETMVAVSAPQDTLGRVTWPRRDLIATGFANIVNGFAGGSATTGNVAGTFAVTRAGGTTWLSLIPRCVFLVVFIVVLSPALAVIPIAAIAGVLIATGLRLVDLDGLRPGWRALRHGGRHRVDVLCSALVILVVAGIAIRWSLVAAVGVGIPLSVVVFAAAMGRDLVRRAYRNPIGRSRLRWPEQETAVLIAGGARIAVVEIEGAIFFGSVDTIARKIEAERADGADYVVLDTRRITSVDLSGARRLVQICNRLWQEGVHLSLAYVRPGMAVWDYLKELALLDRLRKSHVFPSLDAALEAVETALLTASGTAAQENLTPEAALRGLGLPEDAVSALLPHLTEVRFEIGDLVIRAGEEARSGYLLLSGRLDVTIPLTSTAALRTRLTTITAGTLVGEMALLSGAPRSADVVARTAAVCLRFDAETVAVLRRDRPEVAYHLLTCIALQIDRNLRLANMTIASLEG